MLLEQVAHYNDLSPKLREELSEKLRSFGKRVRFKFNIAKPNPDPSKYNGDTVYPNIYTLDPCVFNILDPYEDRKDKSKSKRIGLVEKTDEKGLPERFGKIRVAAAQKSILSFELEEGSEDWYRAMMLLIHPKLSGGKFSDKQKQQVVSVIDEQATAKTERAERTARVKALNAAQGMNEKELKDFADAMLWDSTEDEEVLRNMAEAMADSTPVFFNDLVAGKNVEYKAAIKQALDRKILEFDPAEYKFIWAGNKQTIAVLSPIGEKHEIDKMAEWLQSNGQKADEVYKKIRSLLK